MTPKINILVVGATGKQGGAAISALLASPNSSSLSLHFLTLNTTSTKALQLVNLGATAVKGDLEDVEAISLALEGMDRAFFMTDADSGEEKEIQQGKNFVDAAKEAGVGHLVFTSSCAADTAVDVPRFRSKYEVEKYLIASGIYYTILRPVAFMDNLPKSAGFSRFMGIGASFAFSSYKPCAYISFYDIGVFASKALLSPDDPTFLNTTIDLSAGVYGLEDTRMAIRKAQGHSPWIAGYLPTFSRMLLPHTIKTMFIFFESPGYPPVDVDKLRKIHPALMSMEDYFRSM